MAKDKQTAPISNVLTSAFVTGASRALAAPAYMPLISLELHSQNNFGKTSRFESYPAIYKQYFKNAPLEMFRGTTAQAVRNFREFPRMLAWLHCDGLISTSLGLASADLVCNTMADNVRNTMAMKQLGTRDALRALAQEKGLARGLLDKGSIAFAHSFAYWGCFKLCNDFVSKHIEKTGFESSYPSTQAIANVLVGIGTTAGMMPLEHFRNRCVGKGSDLEPFKPRVAARMFCTQLYQCYQQQGLLSAIKGSYRGGAIYCAQNILTAVVTNLGLKIGEKYKSEGTKR